MTAAEFFARNLAQRATVIPGGTKYPGRTLPTEHRFYATAVLYRYAPPDGHGQRLPVEGWEFVCGADAPDAARERLFRELAELAEDPEVLRGEA